ncbi:protein kinase ssp1 [Orbilia oligospora]|uniref:Peptidyl-prolyl cis-trans isomerase n=1 Tax=Orbilia oligospora TaxID=2813651 RepID=A0A7C8NV52_ORBOL|nr:protein kinase ssp1 [Orbilia oligospora]KAF3134384.1 protein kinase ssp1 [Orbilia oligospora]
MSEAGLPPNWEVRVSKTRGIPYYFHPQTQESRWEPPQGTDSEKLKAYIAAKFSSSGASDQNSKPQGEKIRAAHLLVKHEGSRRPSSWKDAEITRTKEEARSILQGYEERIRGGSVTLAELAKTESDCSSARKGGDLGYFGRGDMQKEFEDASFALLPGEMSGIVETASGLHLIERYSLHIRVHPTRNLKLTTLTRHLEFREQDKGDPKSNSSEACMPNYLLS